MKRKSFSLLLIAVLAAVFLSGCFSPFDLFRPAQDGVHSTNDFFDILGEITEDAGVIEEELPTIEAPEQSESQTEESSREDSAVTANIEFKDEDGNILLNGEHIESASVSYDYSIGRYILLRLTDEGSKLFAEATANNIGKTISIYVNDELVSAPIVNDVITGGEAMIFGNFTEEEANKLCENINSAIIS